MAQKKSTAAKKKKTAAKNKSTRKTITKAVTKKVKAPVKPIDFKRLLLGKNGNACIKH